MDCPELSVPAQTVCLWCKRIARQGAHGIREGERRGRPPRIAHEVRPQLIAPACEVRKPEEWVARSSTRLRGRAVAGVVVGQISRSHVQRIPRAGDIRAHRVQRWLHVQTGLSREGRRTRQGAPCVSASKHRTQRHRRISKRCRVERRRRDAELLLEPVMELAFGHREFGHDVVGREVRVQALIDKALDLGDKSGRIAPGKVLICNADDFGDKYPHPAFERPAGKAMAVTAHETVDQAEQMPQTVRADLHRGHAAARRLEVLAHPFVVDGAFIEPCMKNETTLGQIAIVSKAGCADDEFAVLVEALRDATADRKVVTLPRRCLCIDRCRKNLPGHDGHFVADARHAAGLTGGRVEREAVAIRRRSCFVTKATEALPP